MATSQQSATTRCLPILIAFMSFTEVFLFCPTKVKKSTENANYFAKKMTTPSI